MAVDIKLWIGGSSGLARTYFNAFSSDDWVLLGLEDSAPDWLPALSTENNNNNNNNSSSNSSISISNNNSVGDNDSNAARVIKPYVSCDLTKLAVSTKRKSRTDRLALTVARLGRAVRRVSKTSRQRDKNDNKKNVLLSSSEKRSISHIVVGIRPPLVTHRNNQQAAKYCHDLMTGYSLLLHALTVKFEIKTVIHVSSIAAVDHIPRQHFRSVRSDVDPDFQTLENPYDSFKRGCEELTELVCTSDKNKNIRFTSVRLGAIFSDTPRCIQCSALALQCYLGPYLNVPIDCNSSRNVATLIHLMMHSVKPMLPVYYYTRCVTCYPKPVPYGEYLLAYRKAYNLHSIPILLPALVVEWCVVRPFHWFVVLLSTLLWVVRFVPAPPFLESIDYLLQVTLNEHTFDMRETVRDFPLIRQAEESMEACFRRRRAQLEEDAGHVHKKDD